MIVGAEMQILKRLGFNMQVSRGVGVLVAADAVRSTCHIAMSSIT